MDKHFVGLSFEKSHLSTSLFSHSSFFALIRGNSTGHTDWDKNGNGLHAGWVAPEDINRFAHGIKYCRNPVVYGMNFVKNTPENMANEAYYVAHALDGFPIYTDGTWPAPSIPVIPVYQGTMVVEVQPASALLVKAVM